MGKAIRFVCVCVRAKYSFGFMKKEIEPRETTYLLCIYLDVAVQLGWKAFFLHRSVLVARRVDVHVGGEIIWILL